MAADPPHTQTSGDERNARWSLPVFAVRRPVTVLMITLTCMGLGYVTWSRLPLSFMVDISHPALRVFIPYPGASPEQVEQEVAIPSEGEFKTITGLDRITTHSSSGGCYIWMEFVWDTDMSVVSAEVRDRMERLKLRLPQEIEHLFLRRFGITSIPVMRFAVFRKERSDELAQYARSKLRNRLMRLEGVAEVRISGAAEESISVDFSQDALAAHRLSVYEVLAALRTQSIDLGLGKLGDGENVYHVRAEDEFKQAEDLEAAVVAPSGIRLRDVAQVTTHGPAGAESFQVDGKRGVFFEIIREPDANAVATCDRVREELARSTQEPEFQDAEMLLFEDQSEIIRFALDNLYLAGKYGAVLAILVLWCFLRRVEPTLVVAAAIPCSIVAAPIFIFFTGRSLNLVTIAAMLISIGMLVDNAIVVVENIHRHNSLRPDRRGNALRGAAEVALAITASTFTTLVVFIPVIYMPAGELSTIMREFAGPITCALLASLLMALTLIPVVESRAGSPWMERITARLRLSHYRNRPQRPGPRRFQALFHPLGRIQAYYQEGLRATLERRHVTLALILALILTTYLIPYQETGFRGFPEMDMRVVRVRFEADPNYGHEQAVATVDQLLARVEAQREALGIKHLYVNSGGWGGQMDIYLMKPEDLAPGQTLPCSTEEARERIYAALPQRVPGGRVDCGVSYATPEESRDVRVRFRGDDTERLDQIAREFMRRMRSVPRLTEIKSAMPAKDEEIQLHVDEERAASMGVSPLAIAQSVDFALRGTNLPYLKRDGAEVAVRGQLSVADRSDKGDLEAMSLPGPGGKMMTLAQLVDMRKADTPPSVFRSNAKGYTEVQGRVGEENLLPVRQALNQIIQNFETPRGYSIELDEQLAQIDELMHQFRLTVAMSVVLIYLVLAAVFESWLLPLSVLTTVPLAFVGVYWSLHLTETPLDTIGLVGSVILCGVIVNNGIVIIDHINRLRRSGLSRSAAVIQGGLDRLRPVLMTTLTTILGVLPIAVGTGGAQGALEGLGRALVGGLTAGTALTLFVVPLAYTLVDDLRDWTWRFFSGIRRMGQAPSRDGARS